MPATYHLHASPSQSSFAFSPMTPPASPPRRFQSPSPTLSEADMAGTVCPCGKQLFDPRGCCPACFDRQQKRRSRQSSDRHEQLSTPPPSSLPTPRGSIDGLSALPISPLIKSRTGLPAGVALNQAVAEEDSLALFPSSLIRSSSRSPRSPHRGSTSISTPERTPTMVRHSQDQTGPVVDQLANPASPEWNRKGSSAREYSPMAAGFARLARDRAPADMPPARRQRGSLDLEARLFDGPA